MTESETMKFYAYAYKDCFEEYAVYASSKEELLLMFKIINQNIEIEDKNIIITEGNEKLKPYYKVARYDDIQYEFITDNLFQLIDHIKDLLPKIETENFEHCDITWGVSEYNNPLMDLIVNDSDIEGNYTLYLGDLNCESVKLLTHRKHTVYGIENYPYPMICFHEQKEISVKLGEFDSYEEAEAFMKKKQNETVAVPAYSNVKMYRGDN